MPELEYFAVKLDDQWERIEILDGNASKVKVKSISSIVKAEIIKKLASDNIDQLIMYF